MRNRIMPGVSLAAVLLAYSALPAADAPKSGPQVGSTSLDVFNPLNVTGARAGKRACQV
jgi:hypothetical protein